MLRTTLDALEAALGVGREARSILQETCATLSRHLREHMQRESRLAAAGTRRLGRWGADDLRRFGMEHHEEWRFLRAAKASAALDSRHWLDASRPIMVRLLERFRERMDEQEVELFPLLERIFGEPQGPVVPLLQRGPRRTMRDLQAVAAGPTTRAVMATRRLHSTQGDNGGVDEAARQRIRTLRQLLTRFQEEAGRRQRQQRLSLNGRAPKRRRDRPLETAHGNRCAPV